MKKKKSTTPTEYNYLHASSPQDFTGLIPAGPVDEEELKDYSEIYPIYPKVPRKPKD